MIKMRIFITILIILTGSLLKAQVQIENVDFKIKNNLLEIEYDLAGIGTWSVNIYYSTNKDSIWRGPLINITGDVNGISVGKNKLIICDILNENNKDWLIEENLKIKVKLSTNTGSYRDSRDSTIYRWVKIGNQVWMAENLKATKYTDGTPIPIVIDFDKWRNPWNKSCCLYKNDRSYLEKYGVLYNWEAATRDLDSEYNPSGVQGVCPTGWHIPSDVEWEQLAEFIRATKGSDVGQHLKSQNGWKYSNGTDSLGFSALPGGERSKWDGKFWGEGIKAAWWSTKSAGGYRRIYCSKKFIDYEFESKNAHNDTYGFSVRCVKD
jgi:uncharacterized protein (TIGR02145 family)